MSRASFMEDFFGRTRDQNQNLKDNAHLFDITRCEVGEGGQFYARVEVLYPNNIDYPGLGWCRILASGKSNEPAGCSGRSYSSIILTSPEVKAVRSPIMGARVMFRSDYPLDHQEVFMGFTPNSGDAPVAANLAGFRVMNDASPGKWYAVHKVSGQESSAPTDVVAEVGVPHEFVVNMTPEVTSYLIDGRVVWERRAAAPPINMTVEIYNAIYNWTASVIQREVLVDYVYGSLER